MEGFLSFEFILAFYGQLTSRNECGSNEMQFRYNCKKALIDFLSLSQDYFSSASCETRWSKLLR